MEEILTFTTIFCTYKNTRNNKIKAKLLVCNIRNGFQILFLKQNYFYIIYL